MKGLNLFFFRSKHFLLIQSLVNAQMQIIELQECLLLDACFLDTCLCSSIHYSNRNCDCGCGGRLLSGWG